MLQNRATIIIKLTLVVILLFLLDRNFNFRTNQETKQDPASIIRKTKEFADQLSKAEDPDLVEFVRTLLVTPFPEASRNLTNKSKVDHSQIGQSLEVDKLLQSKQNGFYVEVTFYSLK